MRLFPKGMDSTATFTRESLMRPPARWCDVVTRLRHFAIVTYAIPPERLRPLVDPRFDLDCIVDGKNGRKAMVSMVPFEDQDFHFAGCPWGAVSFRPDELPGVCRGARHGPSRGVVLRYHVGFMDCACSPATVEIALASGAHALRLRV
jgi:hypothetical protein